MSFAVSELVLWVSSLLLGDLDGLRRRRRSGASLLLLLLSVANDRLLIS